jgi:hypothetical protein
VTVQVTPSTGIAWPPSNFVGELTAHPVTDVWVTHAFSPGQPPATVVQGPSGMSVGKVPTGHDGGFAGHLRTQPPFGPVQVPTPAPEQQPSGAPLPVQKELVVQLPVPAPVQHG